MRLRTALTAGLLLALTAVAGVAVIVWSWWTHLSWRPGHGQPGSTWQNAFGREVYSLQYVWLNGSATALCSGPFSRDDETGAMYAYCSDTLDAGVTLLQDPHAWPQLLVTNWHVLAPTLSLRGSGSGRYQHRRVCGRHFAGDTVSVWRDGDNYFHFLARFVYFVYGFLQEGGLDGTSAGASAASLDAAALPDTLLLADPSPHDGFSPVYETLVKQGSGTVELASRWPQPYCFDHLAPRAVFSGFSTGHLLPVPEDECIPNSVLVSMRRHLLHHLVLPPSPPATAGKLLIVSRQDSPRRIVNFGDMLDALDAHRIPYAVVNFANMTVLQQISAAAAACGMLGLHGAGLTNSLFMPLSAPLIEIMPHITDDELSHGKQAHNLAVFYNWACGVGRPFHRYVAPQPLDTDTRDARGRRALVNATAVAELVQQVVQHFAKCK